ncbi:MAG: triose-phosphate isomerase [Bacillota bacterium]
MRKPIVAGNWKMNKTVAEAHTLVEELVLGLQSIHGVEKVLCPPFTALMAVYDMVEGTDISVGAQNLFWETSGAYTGEESPLMIKEFCKYVIIGHSERRAYFNETDETVNRKTKTALNVGLLPIVCVGETLKENEAGQTSEVVTRQVLQGLKNIQLPESESLVVAYEPVWAIGTGRAATSEGANSVIKDMIRPALAQVFGESMSQKIRIQYGGSVTAKNAAELFAMSDIDGALVGGASLKSEDFVQIVQAAAK